jgi:hypothetical protein
LVWITAATCPVAGTLLPFGGSTGLAGVDAVTYVQLTVPGEAAATLTLDVVRVEDVPVVVVVDAHADSRAAPTRIMRAL